MCSSLSINVSLKLNIAGGSLVCCEHCPASYHHECCETPPDFIEESVNGAEGGEVRGGELRDGGVKEDEKVKEVDALKEVEEKSEKEEKEEKKRVERDKGEKWMCELCTDGKRPMYGEIVWCKAGVYRSVVFEPFSIFMLVFFTIF